MYNKQIHVCSRRYRCLSTGFLEKRVREKKRTIIYYFIDVNTLPTANVRLLPHSITEH